jgi:glycosyltransferase involved in cell wall biosynthesis
MQILHIIKNFDFGGAENHLCELANGLDSLGNQIFIVGGKGRQQALLNRNVRFIPVRLIRLLLPVHLVQMVCLVRKMKIQVIHAHQRYPIFLACLVGKITGIPVVATVHGRTQYDLRSGFSRRHTSRILFVSRFVLEAAQRFPEIRQKATYIPNGVTIPEPTTSHNSHQITYISRLDSKHSAVVLLMLEKVLPVLLVDFPEITFNVVGSGRCLEKVQEAATCLNRTYGRKICTVSGFQPQVREQMQDSMLVMGVGRVALEALACGIPVLCVNKKHLGTMLSTKNFPFYKTANFVAVKDNPPEAESLSRHLRDILANISFWKREANLLRELVDKKFNILKVAARVEALYKEL